MRERADVHDMASLAQCRCESEREVRLAHSRFALKPGAPLALTKGASGSPISIAFSSSARSSRSDTIAVGGGPKIVDFRRVSRSKVVPLSSAHAIRFLFGI